MKIGKRILLITTLSGILIGAIRMNRVFNRRIMEKQERADKYWTLFVMMNQWIKIKQEGKNLSDYFLKKGYKKLAIYGMGHAGKTLLEELKDSNIEISYGIDKRVNNYLFDIEVKSLEDNLPEVDVIVVTAVTYFDEIKEELSKKTNITVISLSDILYEI